MAAGNSAPSAAARALAYAEAEATRRRVLEAEHTLGRVPREAVDMRDEEQSDDEVAAGLGQEPPSPGPWDGDERDRAPLPVLGSREQPFELEPPQEPAPSPSPAPRAAAAAAPAPRPAPKRWSPLLEGCRNVHRYKRLNTIDEGTFGVVHRAQDRETGRIVALKRLKTERRSNQFPITSLREINILLSLRHENVVELIEMVTDPETDDVFMVMEFMEHDMKMLLRQKQLSGSLFPQAQVKTLMQQLLAGVHALHSNWVLHRDLKTSNLLLNDKGVLKLADFGLARKYTLPCGQYTQPVVTLWYRAPELLLGAKQYGPEVDMWSVGCIMAELLSCEPLFPGKGEFDQISTIFATLGTPTKEVRAAGARARALSLPLPHSRRRRLGPALRSCQWRAPTRCPSSRPASCGKSSPRTRSRAPFSPRPAWTSSPRWWVAARARSPPAPCR